MMTATIIAGFLFVLLLGFLFTPITLYIDTNEDRYEVFQLPVLRFAVTFQNLTPFPHFQLIGFDIPLKPNKRKSSVKTKVSSRFNFHKSISAWKILLWEAMHSFRIKKGVMDVDTDDVVLNAHLVPVLMTLSGKTIQLRTNFVGRVYFHLEIYTRPARLLWIFLRFLTIK